jgi:hypothetical protein
MKKARAIVYVILLLMGLASNGLAEEITLKPSGTGQWTIYDSEGQDIGTLAREQLVGGGYSILPKGGRYLGIVRNDGNLMLTGRHPVITASDAMLYLDVLEAIKTLK